MDQSSSSTCPVAHAEMDPLTNLPTATRLQQDGSQSLGADRQTSSIPRSTPDPDGHDRWLYPSPRMFHAALKRKGFPSDATSDIESMVAVHNFLNEGVWTEIRQWESMHEKVCPCGPTLSRFMGRPSDLSPKAWLYTRLYGGEAPFDRHDWTVNRCGREVRYVIDYYPAGPGEFSVDVRPALDSFGSFVDRIRMAWRSFAASPPPSSPST